MGDTNRYSGAITIAPPLTGAEIRKAPNSVLDDVRLKVRETVTPTDDGEIVVRTADAIVPTCDGRSGRTFVDDLHLLVDHLLIECPGRAFAGYIEVERDPGYGLTPPSRYVVRDGRVLEVKAQIVWPDEPDPALTEARGLAILALDILRQLPTFLDEFDPSLAGECLPEWAGGEAETWQRGAGDGA